MTVMLQKVLGGLSVHLVYVSGRAHLYTGIFMLLRSKSVISSHTQLAAPMHSAGLDDPAIVCGIGTIDDMPFMFIGHQKGRNTKENIYRNFGMPQPNGYRKALRFMRHADKFGFPILTFVDTPGAYAGKAAEELGQVG